MKLKQLYSEIRLVPIDKIKELVNLILNFEKNISLYKGNDRNHIYSNLTKLILINNEYLKSREDKNNFAIYSSTGKGEELINLFKSYNNQELQKLIDIYKEYNDKIK